MTEGPIVFLKSLEVCGFKSFADKTEIIFERGLTAIVGPNGCGKSNIVDAIRWALGEQSAKSLRGGAMTDVIFNGGGRRGPQNLAEVTLVFDNSDRTLAVERDVVRVTRRLYRSGESEYVLDAKPSRLRDIRELLLDTGAGASAATFVEQGKIDALLHASADERRHVLEEAAGIGKFKIRRKETLDRLEEVSKDRAQLGCVLGEVVARHEEVKAQALKAGKFVEVRDRLKVVRTELARRKRAGLEKRAAEAAARGEKARADAATEGSRAARLAEESRNLAERKRSQESAQRNAELELRDIVGALEGRRREVEQEEKRGKELADDRARLGRSLAEAEKRAKALDKEIEAGRKAAESLEEKDAGLGDRVSALEARAQDLEKRTAQAAAEVERGKRELVARMQEESTARNRVAELDARSRVLNGREERLRRKRAEVAAALAEREAEGEALARSASAAFERAGVLEEELRSAGARREAAERALRAAEEAFLEARKRHSEVEARLEALRRLEREGDGLAPGARALLERGGEGLLGPLADLLALDRASAPAIAAALGARAEWVVYRTEESAVAAARWLAGAGRGRAGVIALEAGGGATSPGPRGVEGSEGFLGWAADVPLAREEARPLVARVLAGVAIVRDLDAALAVARQPALVAAVSLAGELASARAAIEAGADPKGGGRVERIAERQELEKQAAFGAADLDERRRELDRLRGAQRAAEKEQERLRSEHNEARLQAFSAKKEREERERGLGRVREEARLNEAELGEIAADLKEALEGLKAVESEVTRQRDAAGALDAAVAVAAQAARAIEAERSQVREELHDLKVRLARGTAELEGAREAAARAERELVENGKARVQLAADQERVQARCEESRAQVERWRAESAQLAEERARREEKLAADLAALRELAKRLDETRGQEEAAQAARTRADQVLAQAEREAREAAVRLEELASRVRDELSVELSSLEPPPPPREGEPPFSEAAAEREAAGLRRKLEEIGPVNLEALEECEKLAERRTFLEAQVRDLDGAEENLRAAIRKINETSRKRFLETFEAVRENFREIFRKLFGGGKADLELEEGKDILEAGVEVTARPPGKEARTLTLLSGGEKVLTTVALLFAVFRAKPGPFCILDEVDAALDEHNVGRFVSLVREFLDRSQFLIITHNKRTMKAADALYGVTMPEQGVSAPVSVRFGRVEEDAAAAPALPAGAAAAP